MGTGVVSVPSDVSPLPWETALYQNYPNPFNPTTFIRYQLAAPGHVEIRIFDLLGREVAILVNEQKPAGTYGVTFEGRTLASGVYLCRMTAGQYTATTKLLLLR